MLVSSETPIAITPGEPASGVRPSVKLPHGNAALQQSSYCDQLAQHESETVGAVPPPKGGRRVEALQKWRLRRVMKYIDDHVGHRVTLADMAAAAGLTSMHFAAQFRCATGMRPHDYLLQRRIGQACELLRNTRLRLVEVALSVGFQTQPHFTTVFKRIVGQTPVRWRRLAQHVDEYAHLSSLPPTSSSAGL
jgi:AraC-like DNA-binding protein